MRQFIKKTAAGTLTAIFMVTTFMPAELQAKKKSWYADMKAADNLVQTENGVLAGGNTKVPSVGEPSALSLKKASQVPSAYMNTLAQVTEKYPGTRDQGLYETCWAFSAIGLAEFDMINDGTADKSIDLSELQNVYFTYHNAEDRFAGTYGDSLNVSKDYRQLGGNLNYGSRVLLQWQGVTNEEDVPYSQIRSQGTLGKEYAFDRDVAHLQNVHIINIHKDPAAVKKEIMEHGSAGVAYYAGDSNYTEGLYDITADYNGETVSCFYCPVKKKPNHAVNAVGWDDNFPASAFKDRPAGNGAWYIRNSWTDESGNNLFSYFWISYYDKSLEDAAWFFDMEPADNYDFNYQYDGGAFVHSQALVNVSSKKFISFPTSANVFKVQGAGNELLKAVSITLNENTNVPYTIKVYTNLTNPSKPRSGILAAKLTGKTTYAGTYTIPLKTAVSMPKGTYYSVVVELGKKNATVDMEISYKANGMNFKAYADYNQSLVYYQNAWEDMADLDTYGIGNLCIKGFTTKTGTTIKRTENLRAKSIKKTSAKLSWSKTDSADGYVVYRASSKNGRYYKLETVNGRSCTSRNLKPGKTYYYKVRAYKKVNNVTVYGKLSPAVKVKTKK